MSRRLSPAWTARTGCACALAGMLLAHAAAQPEDRAAAAVTDAVAAAQQHRAEGVSWTPEFSAVRTRLGAGTALPLGADGRLQTELAGLHYRLWLSRGRTDIGLGVGTLGHVLAGPDGRIEGPLSLAASTPTVSLGLRWRVTPDSAVYADASSARGLGLDPAAGYVNTQLGMEWKPAKPRWGFEHGAIGMRFDSGYRLSLKAREGGLGLYLRGQF